MIPGSVPSEGSGGSNVPPVRHSRPLTAAELHLELEKEQEAVVNRLTRELTALQAQSSTAAAYNESLFAGASSSSVETPFTGTGNHSLASSMQQSDGIVPPGLNSIHREAPNGSTHTARRLSSTIPSHVLMTPRPPASASETVGPAEAASFTQDVSHSTSSAEGDSAIASGSGAATVSDSAAGPRNQPPSAATHLHYPAHPAQHHGPSFSSVSTSSSAERIQEAAHARNTLEAAKRENTALVARLKGLEQELKRRGATDA